MSPVQSWPISIGFFVSAVAIGAMSLPVRADEAYLCGPDKVIYVSAADLPNMKRTNACVAAYYGLKVEASAKAVADVPAEPKRATVAQVPDAKPAKAAQVALKPISELEPSTRAAEKPVRQAALAVASATPVALPGTDYRNVKILNAANPEDAVYRHTK